MDGETAQTLRIDRLGHLGDGIAETGGATVYAPFALPGETVAGTPEGDRLRAARVLDASPARVTPACRHFGVCGGCALQHASDDFLAEWKAGLIAGALASRGLSGELRPIAVSPPAARRRVAFSGRRTKKAALLGFHGRAEAAIVDLAECPVADPAIFGAMPELRRLAGIVGSRSGEVRIFVTASEAGLDVAIRGPKPLDAALRETLGAAAERADWARIGYEGETAAERRPPIQRFGAALVSPPAEGFLQATREGEATLVAAVTEAVGDAATVADLFAGSGTFALPLAGRATVRAVEAEAAALAALDAGWRRAPGLRTVTTETRDLFRRPLTAGELARFEAVVIDPPRAGAAAQVAAIAAARVPRVAMASCNPATFARDARTLVDAGYRLEWIQPVDQFRWSPHVELAAAFVRG